MTSVWHPSIPVEYRNRVVCGDCRVLLLTLPDQCATFAFADPPYWVGYDYGERTDSDMAYIDPVALVTELQRIARVVCVTPGISNLHDYPKPVWIAAWLKRNTMKRVALGFNHWEPILVYGSIAIKTSDQGPDVFDAPLVVDNSLNNFACPKPIKLLQRLLERFTQPGDTVVDPVAGSGTTGAVAKQLGRDFVCFEIDPITAERAQQRIDNTQPPLFVLSDEQLTLPLE